MEEQKKDEQCRTLTAECNKPKHTRNKHFAYLDKNGMLCKSVLIRDFLYKIIVISQLTHIIVVEFHSSKGHQGTICPFETIWRNYWWPKLCQDIVKFITHCPLCIKIHSDITMYTHLHLQITKIPLAILAMDIIGRLPVASKGHHYTISAICLHTSFIFVIPLKERSGQHIVYAYLIGILAKVGGSYTVLLDNRTEFWSKSLIDVCDQLGIKNNIF